MSPAKTQISLRIPEFQQPLSVSLSIAKYPRVLVTKSGLFKYMYIKSFTSINWKLSDQKTPIFIHISAQNINCGYSLELHRRRGSNEYHQSMFLNKNKKYNVYPFKPYIKWGFRGSKLYRYGFVMSGVQGMLRTVQKGRLICILAGCTCPNVHYLMLRL